MTSLVEKLLPAKFREPFDPYFEIGMISLAAPRLGKQRFAPSRPLTSSWLFALQVRRLASTSTKKSASSRLWADRLEFISVIVDGEPNDPARECFPPAVRFTVGQDGQITTTIDDPIAADARHHADGRDLARDKVIAGLLGLSLDEIRKRAIRAQRRRVAALTSISFLMAGLAVVASIAAWIARQRTVEAEQRLDLALATAESLTTKTVTFKDKFGVPIPILTDLLHEVDQLLSRLEQEGVKSSKLEFREAKLLAALSDSNTGLGNTPKALEQIQQAVDKLTSVTGALPNGTGQESVENGLALSYLLHQAQQMADRLKSTIIGTLPSTAEQTLAANDLGWAYQKLGDILQQQSRLADAKSKYDDARQVFELLAAKDPSNSSWQTGLSSTLSRLSDVLSSEGNLEESRALLDQDLVIARRLVSMYGGNTYFLSSLGLTLNKRGALAAAAGELDDAIKLFTEASDINEQLARADATNAQWADYLAQSKSNLGFIIDRQGNLAAAISFYISARDIRKRLSDEDPLNMQKLDNLATMLSNLGFAYQRTGNLGDAQSIYERVVETRKNIYSRNPTDLRQVNFLTIALDQLAHVQASAGDTTAALKNAKEALDLGSKLVSSDPSNLDLKMLHALHLQFVWFLQNVTGIKEGAAAILREIADLSDELSNNDPTNVVKAYQAIIARVMLALSYREAGQPEQSLNVLKPATTKATIQREKAPEDALFLNALSAVYEQIYLSNWDLGDMEAARVAARACLEVSKQWSTVDAGNSDALSRVALAYTIVGNAERRLKRLSEAREAVSSGLEIRKKLDHNNKMYRSDLATSWLRLDEVLWDQGDYTGALDAAQHALDINKELLEDDSSNLQRKRNLAKFMAI